MAGLLCVAGSHRMLQLSARRSKQGIIAEKDKQAV